MAETKYGKYFIEYDPKQWPAPPQMKGESPYRVISRVDNHVAEGSFYYVVQWVLPGIPMGFHPPHIHKYDELLFHIGANPDDPMDLGAEVEMCMGEELEKHTFNRSTVLWIPAGLVHSPWTPVSYKPWIVIEVHQGPMHTYKGCHHLLPKKTREQYKDTLSKVKDEGF